MELDCLIWCKQLGVPRLVDGWFNKCDVKMAGLVDVRFIFINDTKQGALLQYRRTQTALDVGENCEIVGEYVHFTVKNGNFLKTGDETNANSCFGTGFLELNLGPGKLQIYAINWFTYFTNGNFKEVVMRIAPDAQTQIVTYLPKF